MIQCEPSRSVDALLREIHSMDRERCIHELTHFQQLPLDFDRAFLSGMSVEQLRHVLTAAVRTVHSRPRIRR